MNSEPATFGSIPPPGVVANVEAGFVDANEVAVLDRLKRSAECFNVRRLVLRKHGSESLFVGKSDTPDKTIRGAARESDAALLRQEVRHCRARGERVLFQGLGNASRDVLRNRFDTSA